MEYDYGYFVGLTGTEVMVGTNRWRVQGVQGFVSPRTSVQPKYMIIDDVKTNATKVNCEKNMANGVPNFWSILTR